MLLIFILQLYVILVITKVKSIYKFNCKNPEIFVTIISGFLFTKSDKNGMMSIVTSLVKKI